MKIHFSLLLLILICTGLSSCTEKKPKMMSDSNFSKIYARLMLINETVPPTSDSLVQIKRRRIDSLFTAWDSSEREFREAVRLYHQTPGEWPKILRMVGQEIDSVRVLQK
jgi:hypothetical protein